MSYGQLLIEKAKIEAVEDDIMDQIFDFMVRDMSAYALDIYSKTSSTEDQKQLALDIIKAPVSDAVRFERVWQQQVFALKGQYSTGL